MEHSLQTYLEKLSTERLEAFLKQCYAREFTENFSSMIPYVEYVLERRKADSQ